jgi:ATP-dependent DNA helicase DinG
LFCIPEDGPSPKQANFNIALCDMLWPLLQASDGGVFYLCTTLRATQQVGDWLQSKNSEFNLSWTILVQGTRSKGELLDQFRSEAKPILVGSVSFWEGVDVKGQGLRLVVIDKIPFAPPDDPLVAARSDWMRNQGMNPFRDMAIPEAAIALKQGSGRLIRDQSDRGVLVIGDNRILSEQYGKLLWRSLPPFARTRCLDEAVHYMKKLLTEFQTSGAKR